MGYGATWNSWKSLEEKPQTKLFSLRQGEQIAFDLICSQHNSPVDYLLILSAMRKSSFICYYKHFSTLSEQSRSELIYKWTNQTLEDLEESDKLKLKSENSKNIFVFRINDQCAVWADDEYIYFDYREDADYYAQLLLDISNSLGV